jgi:hypothetical protein
MLRRSTSLLVFEDARKASSPTRSSLEHYALLRWLGRPARNHGFATPALYIPGRRLAFREIRIPEHDLAQVCRWADGRIPDHVRDQIRIEFDLTDRTITILECRPSWRLDYGPEWSRFPIARLRYTKTRQEWSLYWRDRNLSFHEYDLAHPSRNVQDLLDEIDRDPHASSGAERLCAGRAVRQTARNHGHELSRSSRGAAAPGGSAPWAPWYSTACRPSSQVETARARRSAQ